MGGTTIGWPSLVKRREADHRRIYSSDPWATCSHNLQGNKTSTSHDRASSARREVPSTRHGRHVLLIVVHLCTSDVSNCGKTRSKLAHALISSRAARESRHRLFQRPLGRSAKASRMGCIAIATRDRQGPQWLQSEVAEAAASRCKIGFRTDWTSRQSIGAGTLCTWYFLPWW